MNRIYKFYIVKIIHSGILGDVYEIKLRRNGYDFRADWQTLQKCIFLFAFFMASAKESASSSLPERT